MIKRSKRLTLKVTPEEQRQIEKLMKKNKFKTRAEFIRWCVLEKERAESELTSVNLKISKDNLSWQTLKLIKEQIRPIGVNINQIAKAINLIKQTEDDLDWKRVNRTLLSIREELKSIERKITGKDYKF